MHNGAKNDLCCSIKGTYKNHSQSAIRLEHGYIGHVLLTDVQYFPIASNATSERQMAQKAADAKKSNYFQSQ